MTPSDAVNQFLKELNIDPFRTKLIEIKPRVVVVTEFALNAQGYKYVDENKNAAVNTTSYEWELSDDFKDSGVSG